MHKHIAQDFQHSLIRVRHYARGLAPLAPLMVLMGMHTGAFAQATGELTTVTQSADSILATINAILRPVSIIAIIGLGLAGGFGKMEWGTVAKVAGGLIVANAATTIVEWFGGGAAQT